MRSTPPTLTDASVEPTAAQWDALTRAALKKAMQRKALAERRFMGSLERSVKRALAEEQRRLRAEAQGA
jgi:hypothetical protein